MFRSISPRLVTVVLCFLRTMTESIYSYTPSPDPRPQLSYLLGPLEKRLFSPSPAAGVAVPMFAPSASPRLDSRHPRCFESLWCHRGNRLYLASIILAYRLEAIAVFHSLSFNFERLFAFIVRDVATSQLIDTSKVQVTCTSIRILTPGLKVVPRQQQLHRRSYIHKIRA